MKKLILIVIGVALVSIGQVNAQLQSNKVALTVQKSSKVCTPDGIEKTDGTEPWTTTWISLASEKSTNTVHEMTAFMQLAYNYQYLWVLPCKKAIQKWIPALLQFPIHGKGTVSKYMFNWILSPGEIPGLTGESFFQFREQRASVFPWGFDDHNSAYTNNPTGWAIGNVDAGDGSFIEEWQIPWNSLVAAMIDSGRFDGSYIRFEILATDNTTDAAGGRNDQRFWINSSDNEYQDSRTLSVVYLATPVKPLVPGDSVNFISPSKSTILKAGTSDTINIYYKPKATTYEYSIYYKIVGGVEVFLTNIYSTGNSSTVWNIPNNIVVGKYNIVIYDDYSGKNYYSDTFNILPAKPKIMIVAPYNGTHIQSGNNMNVQFYSVFNDSINIGISLNNGINWETLLSNQKISANSYKTCKILIPACK